MKGILVVSHGMLSEGILNSAEMLMGKLEAYDFVSLKNDEQPDEFAKIVCEKIVSLDDGEGVLVFVDIFGGTPFNVLVQRLGDYHVECIAGVNLPMLIEAFNNREDMSLEELASYCCEVGPAGIRDVGAFLRSLKS